MPDARYWGEAQKRRALPLSPANASQRRKQTGPFVLVGQTSRARLTPVNLLATCSAISSFE